MGEMNSRVVRIVDRESKVAPGLVSTPMRLPRVEKTDFDVDRIIQPFQKS